MISRPQAIVHDILEALIRCFPRLECFSPDCDDILKLLPDIHPNLAVLELSPSPEHMGQFLDDPRVQITTSLSLVLFKHRDPYVLLQDKCFSSHHFLRRTVVGLDYTFSVLSMSALIRILSCCPILETLKARSRAERYAAHPLYFPSKQSTRTDREKRGVCQTLIKLAHRGTD